MVKVTYRDYKDYRRYTRIYKTKKDAESWVRWCKAQPYSNMCFDFHIEKVKAQA